MQPLRASVDVTLLLNGRPEQSETLWSRGSGNVVVVETAVPVAHLAATLTSAYLGVPGADTLVTHGIAARTKPPRTWSRHIDEGQLCAASAIELFVLDHLAELQDQLGDMGYEARLTVPDEAPRGSPHSHR